jgi:hypothetical protein
VGRDIAWWNGASFCRTERFRLTGEPVEGKPSPEATFRLVERVMKRADGLVGMSAILGSESDRFALNRMHEAARRLSHDPVYRVDESAFDALVTLQAAAFAVSELLDHSVPFLDELPEFCDPHLPTATAGVENHA